METLWAGRILPPARPIAATSYWLGLVGREPRDRAPIHRMQLPGFTLLDTMALFGWFLLCSVLVAGTLGAPGKGLSVPTVSGAQQSSTAKCPLRISVPAGNHELSTISGIPVTM